MITRTSNQKQDLVNWGRPVLIKDQEWQGRDKPKIPRERKGIFHVWGYKRVGGKTAGPSMQTVAIVELEDGRITSKLPDSITFLDRKN